MGGLPYGTRAENQSLNIKTFHQDFDALINGAEEIFSWYKDVVEYQFPSVGATHTELVKFAGTGEARRGLVDNECCDAFRAFFGICLCVHHDVVCIWALAGMF